MKTNKNNNNDNKKNKKYNKNNDLIQSNKYNDNKKKKLTKYDKSVKSNKKVFKFNFATLLAWVVVFCFCSIPLYYIFSTVWQTLKE
jgi:hypothetical protein